jgi:2-polyprenyl-6-methoxyphenol hydroxylase-like FAD-dependent oxidoreductase
MYPMGSNGASQAIVDGGEVAEWLGRGMPVADALSGFQKERIPQIAQIVRSNREGGNERVIDVVAALAPDGFTRLADVISQAQLAQIVTGYSAMAGFSKEAVNG